ncbi:hypothetical protein K402DRAFT_453949 [Aulographum hederae CBS 113979]|uniref:Uncharacterized protein n=1 Tax=Aulographum hederae CBS 113979 TaxID=1176131 RepID=A0A6G1H260_9PEZI|nr:hypothetical protein K402DRAFT_453949 [Aulographum hederae CBS 113979]
MLGLRPRLLQGHRHAITPRIRSLPKRQVPPRHHQRSLFVPKRRVLLPMALLLKEPARNVMLGPQYASSPRERRNGEQQVDFPFLCPGCKVEFRSLAELYGHVELRACGQRLGGHPMKEFSKFLQGRCGESSKVTVRERRDSGTAGTWREDERADGTVQSD